MTNDSSTAKPSLPPKNHEVRVLWCFRCNKVRTITCACGYVDSRRCCTEYGQTRQVSHDLLKVLIEDRKKLGACDADDETA